MGYYNKYNSFGTMFDNSEQYKYQKEEINYNDIVALYEENGLFTRIIDMPVNDAFKNGVIIKCKDNNEKEHVLEALEQLNYEEHFLRAIKLSRLFGWSVIVMHIDDGKEISEPLEEELQQYNISNLSVYSRLKVVPYFSSNNADVDFLSIDGSDGNFIIHVSRCLIFKGESSGAHNINWGIPEYTMIKDAFMRCIMSNSIAVDRLSTMSMDTLKIKGLSNIMETEEGKEKAIFRLQAIDEARGLMNTILIDDKNEDFDIRELKLEGVKEIIESTYDMLAAVTGIPQSKLLLRASSKNSLNKNSSNYALKLQRDMYSHLVKTIQNKYIKKNLRILINLIMCNKDFVSIKFPDFYSKDEMTEANITNIK